MTDIIADFISCLIYRFEGKDPRYLLLKRSGILYEGIWQYVTGYIEGNEHTISAVCRETAEETGLRIIRLFRFPDIARFYLPDDDKIHLSSVFVGQVHRGDGVMISNEHSDFLWAEYEEGMDQLYWPFNRYVLEFTHKMIKKDGFTEFYEIKDIAKYHKI